jgi:hypothetical protein
MPFYQAKCEATAAVDFEKLQHLLQGVGDFIVEPLGQHMDEPCRQIRNHFFKPQAVFEFRFAIRRTKAALIEPLGVVRLLFIGRLSLLFGRFNDATHHFLRLAGLHRQHPFWAREHGRGLGYILWQICDTVQSLASVAI